MESPKKYAVTIVVLIGMLLAALADAGPRWPWKRRNNPFVETFHITAHKKTPIDLWPKEPDSPQKIAPEKFAIAFETLCGDKTERMEKYSSWVLAAAHRFEIDPFVLASLIYDQSQCHPIAQKRYVERGLYGLTHLSPAMHAGSTKQNTYFYFVKQQNQWEQHVLNMDVPLNKWKAAIPQDNIHLAAATLSVFKKQFPFIQREFVWHPYRHYISNWFFGDWVKNPEPENRVLTARRRLLQYYELQGQTIEAGTYQQTALVSPLDGAPRLVIDYFQNKRGKKGGTGHKGIDIDGAVGEPVRAVADGRVVFAGHDLPGGGQHRLLTIAESQSIAPESLPQGGGFYVAINHGNDFGTIYMHLHSLNVEYNQTVKAGDVIGTLGQSGSKKSGPHLHLEFREGDQRVDPAAYLRQVLVNPYFRAAR